MRSSRTDRSARQSRSVRLWTCAEAPGGSGGASLARCVDLARHPDGPLSRPVIARPLARSVIAALLHAADHPYRDLLDERPSMPRPATIRDAVALLEAEPELPWTVTDLARRVEISTRGLQAGFARHVGVAPMAFLGRVRLGRAHLDLELADPARSSVADIAGRWGFTHLGRFAAVYRARYGCLPSQTLRSTG